MKTRLVLFVEFLVKMGFMWVLYRGWYEIRKKTGLITFLNRRIIKKSEHADKTEFLKRRLVSTYFNPDSDSDIRSAEEIRKGIFKVFSNEKINYSVGDKINWHYQPVTKKNSPDSLEWNKIPDFSSVGDIKLIWEPSRFSFVTQFVLAYNKTGDRKYARSCIDLILDWIDSNTFPFGVNYKCGQEISFRLFAWFIALDSFDKFISDGEKDKIIKNIYTSLLRIESNIGYAVKSVRNNHSISEAAGLYIGSVLFPGFSESKKWQNKGVKLLVQETDYQIFDDGSYIQHSMNYHRLAMDIISFVLLIAEKCGNKLPDVLFERHRKMYKFITSFVQLDGTVPNYGSNDGAYLFPLSEYQDFRPSINFAAMVNSGEITFIGQTAISDFFGIKAKENNKIVKAENFQGSGYFQIKNERIYCFIRCHTYETRPAHSDALHIDIWIDGRNIFCDSGSYSYNTQSDTKKQFSGIFGHNTVIVDNEDYMTSVFNFGKTNWPKGKVLSFSSSSFEGENYGYESGKGIIHKREVNVFGNSIIVKDFIIGINKPTVLDQRWHTEFLVRKLKSNQFEICNLRVTSNVNGMIKSACVSRFYNSYSESSVISFCVTANSDCLIETIFTLIE